MKNRLRAFFVLLGVLVTLAGFSTTFQYFSNPIGDQGTFPPFGSSNPNFSSNADHTATALEYGGQALYVTSTGSLTATRTLRLPAIQGSTKDVYNATTGGQSIAVGAVAPDGGTYGTTVTIATNTVARVLCYDGVNFIGLSGAGGGVFASGTGFVHVTDGSVDDAARAVDLSTSDITGTLGHAHGGTDVTSAGTDGGFLRSDGTNWTAQHISDNDIAGLSPAFNIPTANAFTAESFGFSTGFLPGFGRASESFGSDQDKLSTVYSSQTIALSGTQTYRTYGMPLTNASFGPAAVGPFWFVVNGTTNPVQIKGVLADAGPSGTGGWCPRSATCLVRTNGTNYFVDVTSNGSTVTLDDFDGGGVSYTLAPVEHCVANGTVTTCSIALSGATLDASTWVTIGQIKPAVSTGTLVDVAFYALDKGQDAGGVPGNQIKCNLEMALTVGSGGNLNMTANAGSAGPSGLQIPLACVSATGTAQGDGGIDAGLATQSTSFTFQALNTSGTVAIQVKGPDTHLWTFGGSIQRQVQQ